MFDTATSFDRLIKTVAFVLAVILTANRVVKELQNKKGMPKSRAYYVKLVIVSSMIASLVFVAICLLLVLMAMLLFAVLLAS